LIARYAKFESLEISLDGKFNLPDSPLNSETIALSSPLGIAKHREESYTSGAARRRLEMNPVGFNWRLN